MQKIILILMFLIVTISASMAKDRLIEEQDLYLEGYIRSMLMERYSVGDDIEVRSGHVFMSQSFADEPRYEQIQDDIRAVKGVKEVKMVDKDYMTQLSRTWLMPGEPLWKPLLADPRWPKFSAAYRYYTNTKEDYKHVFAATLGKTFSLYRTGFGESMFTEVGVQAAVFPIFDLDTQVLEHINADYLFAIPVTVQFTGISFMGRFSHVSTHLGDQYIRDHPQVKPIHISYEMIDALASFEPNQWFRLYGGGGYIFSPDPSRYGNWQYQGGIELRVISDYVNTNVPTLYVALDVKGLEGSDYTPSTTATIGVEVLDLGKIYFELHDNYTPDGQFYDQKVTWIALGVQLY